MTRLNQHGTELARMDYADCRIAIMSDGHVLRTRFTVSVSSSSCWNPNFSSTVATGNSPP
ncbi:MAG TPA: hypothetical protein VKU19_28115 [Bryobacteraceae bacterium]|nr:hypothetical protein [Bryobacteraceae bacterium]